MEIKCIAVFCGSKFGYDPIFATHTAELGRLIASKNLKVVYGGGSAGLMGLLADTAMAGGASVLGVIPELLMQWEQYHKGITELRTVTDMHVRKKMMYEHCDAAIILPGGFGTLDELFEMLTWNQLRIHSKPIFLLNSGGFYDHLLDHMRHLEKEGFLYDRLDDRIIVCTTPDQIAARLP
ncbi:MAG TPA: TIGR00730 family Rossman fold protein [Puia sp.]|jgi:hypothetical protein|nr:TIGR00730 family Rossman fold protein [Puia sp.]